MPSAEKYEREIARLEDRLRLSEDARKALQAQVDQIIQIVAPVVAEDDGE